ncbi:uncharacterized protein LOC144135169 [Amblyomma americanum]
MRPVALAATIMAALSLKVTAFKILRCGRDLKTGDKCLVPYCAGKCHNDVCVCPWEETDFPSPSKTTNFLEPDRTTTEMLRTTMSSMTGKSESTLHPQAVVGMSSGSPSFEPDSGGQSSDKPSYRKTDFPSAPKADTEATPPDLPDEKVSTHVPPAKKTRKRHHCRCHGKNSTWNEPWIIRGE